MHKLHFWCTLTIIFVLMTSFDSEALEWEKTYSILSEKLGESLKQTPDGGYIITGRGDGHIFLLKTDSKGNQQWYRVFGEEGASVNSLSIELTEDGGYVCVGRYTIISWSDVYLVKTDANGNTLWSQTYGWTQPSESGSDVKITEDNGFIIAGRHSYYRNNLHNQIYLVKTDANGNEVWSRTYGGDDDEIALSIQPTIDGGYITAGYIDNYYDDSDIYLLKVDPTGNELWNKTIGGDYDEKAFEIQQTNDGGFIIAGVQESSSEGEKFALLIKTEPTGDVVWSKTYKGNHEWDKIEARSVKQTSDGGFIITGGGTFWATDGYSYQKAYLLKTDTKGTKTWMKTFPFEYSDSKEVQLTSDDGYIITGRGREKIYTSEEGGVYLAYYNPISFILAPPSSVKATRGTYNDKVRLTWNESSGADDYQVWRNTYNNHSTATRIVSSVTDTFYDDTNCDTGKQYFYWVKASNSNGTSIFSIYATGWRGKVITRNMPFIPLLLLDD